MIRFASFSAIVLAFLPTAAAACPVCGFGEDESRSAYIGTTLFLSALPPALGGGFVFFVRRIVKADAARHEALRR